MGYVGQSHQVAQGWFPSPMVYDVEGLDALTTRWGGVYSEFGNFMRHPSENWSWLGSMQSPN